MNNASPESLLKRGDDSCAATHKNPGKQANLMHTVKTKAGQGISRTMRQAILLLLILQALLLCSCSHIWVEEEDHDWHREDLEDSDRWERDGVKTW